MAKLKYSYKIYKVKFSDHTGYFGLICPAELPNIINMDAINKIVSIDKIQSNLSEKQIITHEIGMQYTSIKMYKDRGLT